MERVGQVVASFLRIQVGQHEIEQVAELDGLCVADVGQCRSEPKTCSDPSEGANGSSMLVGGLRTWEPPSCWPCCWGSSSSSSPPSVVSTRKHDRILTPSATRERRADPAADGGHRLCLH